MAIVGDVVQNADRQSDIEFTIEPGWIFDGSDVKSRIRIFQPRALDIFFGRIEADVRNVP